MKAFGVYSSFKAAVNVLTRTAAKELGPKGIRVNSVSPGLTPTDMTSGLPQAAKDGTIQQTPLGRLGTPEEVAHVVAFLAGPQSSWVTAQIIEVAGGV